jgi:pimeloyl-ACP methyl ester carboxylesterase
MIAPPETRYARNGTVHLAYQVLGEGPGCERAVLLGYLTGCAPALVYAAAHPERVESLVLMGGYARLREGADYPYGVGQAEVDQIAEAVLSTGGSGADLFLIRLDSRGVHQLKGVPGPWEVFAVVS